MRVDIPKLGSNIADNSMDKMIQPLGVAFKYERKKLVLNQVNLQKQNLDEFDYCQTQNEGDLNQKYFYLGQSNINLS